MRKPPVLLVPLLASLLLLAAAASAHATSLPSPAAKAGPAITGTTARGGIALPEHLTQPGSGIAQMGRVDLVA